MEAIDRFSYTDLRRRPFLFAALSQRVFLCRTLLFLEKFKIYLRPACFFWYIIPRHFQQSGRSCSDDQICRISSILPEFYRWEMFFLPVLSYNQAIFNTGGIPNEPDSHRQLHCA